MPPSIRVAEIQLLCEIRQIGDPTRIQQLRQSREIRESGRAGFGFAVDEVIGDEPLISWGGVGVAADDSRVGVVVWVAGEGFEGGEGGRCVSDVGDDGAAPVAPLSAEALHEDVGEYTRASLA